LIKHQHILRAPQGLAWGLPEA